MKSQVEKVTGLCLTNYGPGGKALLKQMKEAYENLGNGEWMADGRDSAIIDQAARLADRQTQIRKELDALPSLLIEQGSGGHKVHPLVAAERADAAEIARLLRQIDLTEPTPPGTTYSAQRSIQRSRAARAGHRGYGS